MSLCKINAFCIGIDESYTYLSKSKILKPSFNANKDYFFNNYLQKGDVVSPILNNRIESVNKAALLYNSKSKNLVNLSPITKINFINTLNFYDFVKKYL